MSLAQLDETVVAQTGTLSLPLVDPTPAVVASSTSTSSFGLTSLVVTAVISVLSSSHNNCRSGLVYEKSRQVNFLFLIWSSIWYAWRVLNS